jgi:hypothetical protein
MFVTEKRLELLYNEGRHPVTCSELEISITEFKEFKNKNTFVEAKEYYINLQENRRYNKIDVIK